MNIPTHDLTILETLVQDPIFRRLSNLERESLAALGERHHYRPQTILFRQDEPSTGIYLLIDGSVELSRNNQRGRRFTLAKLHPGDLFGELEFLDAGPRVVDAETCTPVDAVFFPNAALHKLLDQRDRCALELLYVLCVLASKRLREMNRLLVEVLNEPAALGPASPSRLRSDKDLFSGLLASLYAPSRA